jgi:hypothetical protein
MKPWSTDVATNRDGITLARKMFIAAGGVALGNKVSGFFNVHLSSRGNIGRTAFCIDLP